MSRPDALAHSPSGKLVPNWVFQRPAGNPPRPSFLSYRAAWHHSSVRVEPSSSAPRVSLAREVLDSLSVGPGACLETIQRRLRNSNKATAASPDPRPHEYVERSFAARQARFHELIESLRQAFDDDDMVTTYSEWVTLRRLLNDLRFAAKKDRGERWHMFGILHDAVAFTSIERLRLSMVEAVARAFALACDENTRLIEVHRLLRDSGLDLTPQSSR